MAFFILFSFSLNYSHVTGYTFASYLFLIKCGLISDFVRHIDLDIASYNNIEFVQKIGNFRLNCFVNEMKLKVYVLDIVLTDNWKHPVKNITYLTKNVK